MSNLLIGSSNFARFYKPDLYKDFRPYQMMKCTQLDSFTAMMGEVEDGKNCVVISVFENIIVDAAMAASAENRNKHIEAAIQKVMGLIDDTAGRLPDSKFCIVMPLMRPAVGWYKDMQVEFEGKIRDCFAKLKCFNVTRVNCVCHSLQQFEKDGIHLTPDSGNIFVEAILKTCEEIFESINVEPNADSSKEETKMDMDGLVSVLKTRFEADNLMFARLREEVDSTANKSREDRVVVTGVVSKDPLPSDNRLKIEKLKQLVAEVFEAIKPGFKGKILYASQGRDLSFPMVEVKLDKLEYAVEIRKAFAEKRKKEKLSGILEKIFISNSINVGTRVRIEILKAIAKKITSDQEQAYVVSFISRPIMHIKHKNDASNRPSKSFTFIDAVKLYGSRLRSSDLLGAYAKAGKAFTGQLEQNFVVLKESDSEAAQTNFHQARMGRGRGRGRGGAGASAGDPNKEPMGNRGKKRSGDHGEFSKAKK
jgi:hypothetical protein